MFNLGSTDLGNLGSTISSIWGANLNLQVGNVLILLGILAGGWFGTKFMIRKLIGLFVGVLAASLSAVSIHGAKFAWPTTLFLAGAPLTGYGFSEAQQVAASGGSPSSFIALGCFGAAMLVNSMLSASHRRHEIDKQTTTLAK